ncbi:MAG: hypothetical protein JWN39_2645, partial [Ilumatobacteraceae bacterium]|nr:hypothetical protein [Ilumatobacteraceae bacterium]
EPHRPILERPSLAILCRCFTPAVRGHHPLDMVRRRPQRELQQPVRVVVRRDPGDRTHLRVRQLTRLHRHRELREPVQRMRNPHLLMRRAQLHTRLPRQPRRTRPTTRTNPSAATIEVGDQRQPPRLRRRHVRRTTTDLGHQPLQRHLIIKIDNRHSLHPDTMTKGCNTVSGAEESDQTARRT